MDTGFNRTIKDYKVDLSTHRLELSSFSTSPELNNYVNVHVLT